MLIYEILEVSVSRGVFIVLLNLEISPGVEILLSSIMLKTMKSWN